MGGKALMQTGVPIILNELARMYKRADERGDTAIRNQVRRNWEDAGGIRFFRSKGPQYRLPSGRLTAYFEEAIDSWVSTELKDRWKCRLCGRETLSHPGEPHNCIGGFRKRFRIKGMPDGIDTVFVRAFSSLEAEHYQS